MKLDELTPEEINELRKSLMFDRDRVGSPGSDVRKRAAWLLALMDATEDGRRLL